MIFRALVNRGTEQRRRDSKQFIDTLVVISGREEDLLYRR